MCIISNKVFYGNSVEQPPEELELNKQANVQICGEDVRLTYSHILKLFHMLMFLIIYSVPPSTPNFLCIISNKVFYGNSVEQPPEELELNKQANVQICHMARTLLLAAPLEKM
jgi:hypothetical protein